MGSESIMVLLDTHAWLFWINDNRELLSKNALNAIIKADVLAVSIISCWEIAMLVSKKRLGFNMDVLDWIEQALKYPKIKLIELNTDIAVLSTRLPGEFHGDPADRIIASTCLKNNIPLISKDRKIKLWGQIKVIW